MTDKRTDEKLAEWEARLCRALEKPSAAGGILRVKKSDLRSAIAEIHRLRGERDEAVALMRTYRDKTPLGHQPHMIAAKADAFLAKLEERG